jgi:hypothetical protein
LPRLGLAARDAKEALMNLIRKCNWPRATPIGNLACERETGLLHMPIKKDEIVKVLRDPALKRMFFCVGAITVNAQEYLDVAEYIEAEDIRVVSGRGALAFYDGRNNIIETQAANPPLDLFQSAQILHECTHAIVDVNRLDVLRLNDEVAAYLAQVTFMKLKQPSPLPPRTPGGSPFGRLVYSFMEVVHQYKLFEAEGFGARIKELDIWRLALAVRAYPEYANVKLTDKSVGGGVPVKNDQLRALKAVMKQGQQRRQRIYSPSPRLEIF